MKTFCEDCGCAVYDGRCPNCDEELYILDQYDELNMDYPDEDSEFMIKVRESNNRINNKCFNK